jgi:N-formylmaleamate deformylase
LTLTTSLIENGKTVHAPGPSFMSKQNRFYVEVKGVKLHFLQYGASGPQVLLIPGIISPAITWGFVGERLARNARITIIDNRGRGLSDQRTGLGHTTGDYAEDAAGVIEELGLAPAVVLGHSMGARVAARLSAQRLDLVHRCILADPPVSGPRRRSYPSPLQGYVEDISAASRGAAFPANPKFGEERNRIRREWLPTCSKEAVSLSYAAFHNEDMHADLPKIVCPVLLIYAGQGGVVTEEDAAEITSLLKNGRKIKIDHVGHMMPFEDLEAFVTALQPFIEP